MRKYSNKLYCFSPPVMLATFIVELALVIYAYFRLPPSLTKRIATLLLIFLAIFQFAEYSTCGRLGLTSGVWSNIGFVAITILPPLAIHLIWSLSPKFPKIIYRLAYLSAAPWAILFLRAEAFSGHVCTGNYAIFQLANHYGGYYFVYYYFWLFAGLGLALYLAFTAKKRNTQQALILQAVGYLVFLLPTAMTNTLKPSTVSGLPSIMCGFAVLYAVILVFGILPLTGKSPHPPLDK